MNYEKNLELEIELTEIELDYLEYLLKLENISFNEYLLKHIYKDIRKSKLKLYKGGL